MCGAISGFHALVASGTTPKMIDKESQVRPIGYGAMLMEGVVGIVALIAAASLRPEALLRHQRRPQNTKSATNGRPATGQDDAELRQRRSDAPAGRARDLAKVERWSAANRCAAGPAGR